MKKILAIIALFAIAITSSTALSAQDNKTCQRKSKEEVALLQAQHIASKLNLDATTTKQFTETYCEQQNKIWNVEGRRTKINDSMSDEEIEKIIMNRFENGQKILNIRKEGYAEYRKFLTPRQIEQVYRLEKESMKHMARHKYNQSQKKDGKDIKGGKNRNKRVKNQKCAGKQQTCISQSQN